MKTSSTSAAIPSADLPGMTKLVQVYLLYAVGLLCFYFASPAVSYLMLEGRLPSIGLSTIHGLLLILAFAMRMFLSLTGQLKICTKHLALGYLLLVWISILHLVWLPYISTRVEAGLFFSNMALTLIGPWLLYLGGEAFAYLSITKPRFANRLIFSLYLVLALVIYVGVSKGFKNYGIFLFAFHDPILQKTYNYLALADSTAIVGLLFLGFLDRKGFCRSIIIYIGTLLMLFLSYSRSSFFCFLLAATFLLIQKFWRNRKHIFVLIVVIFAMIICFAWLLPLVETKEYSLGKTSLLLERFGAPFIGTDPSVQSRWELLEKNLPMLKKHWLLGYFMAEVIEIGRGAYIHNWLSFWLAYGLSPFLLSLWILVTLIAKNWRVRKQSSLGIVGTSILAFIFCSISFSRSYTWPYFWFGVSFGGVCSVGQRRH